MIEDIQVDLRDNVLKYGNELVLHQAVYYHKGVVKIIKKNDQNYTQKME